MDNQEILLLESALELLHKLLGYSEAKRDFKPILRFVEDDLKVVSIRERLTALSDEQGGNNEKKEEGGHSKILKFTKKEIESMPIQYKNLFFTENAVAHIRIRNGIYHEIRCQIKGKQITVTSKDLATAKKKFIGKLHELELKEEQKREIENVQSGITFYEYADEWLETVKKPTVKATTYNDYVSIFNCHLFPTFGERELRSITRTEAQQYLNGFIEQGKSRLAHKQKQILTSLFEYALVDELITKSPMQKIKLPTHESENGRALTVDEEREFVNRCLSSQTLSGKAFVFMLCTGLRRSELATAEIDGEWIVVISAKQRKGKIERQRKIPISPRLRRLLPNLETELTTFRGMYMNRLGRTLKEWLPTHHLHELRHTFITRAQECGIAREVVSLWAGHKADNTMTTNVYTHFSEEFQLQEIKKFDY